MKLPRYIQVKMAQDKGYYSLDNMQNVDRCKTDPEYLGDVLLVNENLIWHSVHKYIGKPETIIKNNCIQKDDILQLGRMGFIKAIKAFDIHRGVKFSSFAVTAIVREIRCFLRDSGNIIRPTRTANDLINRINRIENEFGYLPSVRDIVDLVGESEVKVIKAMQVGRPVKYLEETVSSDQSQNLRVIDTLDGNTEIESDVLDKVFLESVIDLLRGRLNENEIKVLQLRMNGYSQTETADEQKMTQMRVSRIMRKIATILKDNPELKKMIGNT